jgi:hypothetical protein
MCDPSTKRALLGLLISLLVNQIHVQADKLQLFPNVMNGVKEIKEGSTLTLTCIDKLAGDSLAMEWRIPPFNIFKEVKTKSQIHFKLSIGVVLNFKRFPSLL